MPIHSDIYLLREGEFIEYRERAHKLACELEEHLHDLRARVGEKPSVNAGPLFYSACDLATALRRMLHG